PNSTKPETIARLKVFLRSAFCLRLSNQPLQNRSFHLSVNVTGSASFFGNVYWHLDRKSTRLNSSHVKISYAVFCLKKKNNYILPSLPPTPPCARRYTRQD